MKIAPIYNSNAFIVPSSVLDRLADTDGDTLACLLYVLANPDFSISAASDKLGIDEADFITALRFWEEAGVIEMKGRGKGRAKTDDGVKTRKKITAANESSAQKRRMAPRLPSYTTEEVARFLEQNASTAELIDTCENILGKIFTTAETEIVIGLLDHLSLSEDYIMLLFAHAVKINKKSVRYIEKMALSYVDRDITKYSELEAELASAEAVEGRVHHVRSLFGIGARALTAKEKSMIKDWCVNWEFSDEIITKAYEITANATGDASLSYANAILENWHNAGLKTAEEVDAYSAEFDKKKKSVKHGKSKDSSAASFESSFDTDDFFEAALRRSFDEAEQITDSTD